MSIIAQTINKTAGINTTIEIIRVIGYSPMRGGKFKTAVEVVGPGGVKYDQVHTLSHYWMEKVCVDLGMEFDENGTAANEII
jgi:hypothetical protein